MGVCDFVHVIPSSFRHKLTFTYDPGAAEIELNLAYLVSEARLSLA